MYIRDGLRASCFWLCFTALLVLGPFVCHGQAEAWNLVATSSSTVSWGGVSAQRNGSFTAFYGTSCGGGSCPGVFADQKGEAAGSGPTGMTFMTTDGLNHICVSTGIRVYRSTPWTIIGDFANLRSNLVVATNPVDGSCNLLSGHPTTQMLSLQKWNPSTQTWSLVGNGDFVKGYNGGPYYLLRFNASGTPFIGTVDGDLSLTAMSILTLASNGSWVFVGNRAALPSSSSVLMVSPTGRPSVYHSPTRTIYRLSDNGTVWLTYATGIASADAEVIAGVSTLSDTHYGAVSIASGLGRLSYLDTSANKWVVGVSVPSSVAGGSSMTGVSISEDGAPYFWGVFSQRFKVWSWLGCPRGSVGLTVPCSACPGGWTTLAIGSSNCTICPKGTYSSPPSIPTCENCPLNTYNPNTGGNTSAACLTCPPGTYAIVPGQSVCKPCPEINGVVRCPCLPGQYDDGTQCATCPPGSYNSVANSTCTICPLGTYRSESDPADKPCLPCPAGKYADTNGTAVCKSCPLGTAQPATGSSSCTECPRGQYRDASISAAVWPCALCPGASYAPTTGTVNCIKCPAGEYGINQRGSVSASVCVSCAKGYYSTTPGVFACTPCAAGTYASTLGNTACTPCPAGTFTTVPLAQTAAGQCQNCPAGFFSLAGSADCTPCPPGYYSSRMSSSSCDMCSAGTYSSSQGASQCETCGPSYAQSLPGQSSCIACNVSFSDTGRVSCFRQNSAVSNQAISGWATFVLLLVLLCSAGFF